MDEVISVKYPKIIKKSEEYTVRFNGCEADVLQACTASFATVIANGKIEVEVEYYKEIDAQNTFVLPLKKGIIPQVSGNTLRFTLDRPQDVAVFINGKIRNNPLFVFGSVKQEKPNPDDENIIFFKGGQVYEVGELLIASNQTVYIEEGAVVRGTLVSKNTDHVKIMGRGVLDGSYYSRLKGDHVNAVLFDTVTDFEIRDIVIMDPTTWIIVIGNCNNGLIDGIREIAEYVGTDGCDLCGSSNITIKNAFVMNNDDCVVIKAFDNIRVQDAHRSHWNKSIDNILVEDCIFLNGGAGNAIEIGHELRTEMVSNVVFRNIDILAVHGLGAALSIHNCDRALVRDILFEDIRIEHCYDKFIDVRVMRSQFGHDIVRGLIKNVLFRNIQLAYSNSNYGYTVSLISGYGKEHLTEDIVFEDLSLNGKIVTQAEDIELCIRDVKNVKFIDTSAGKEYRIDD